ncbi:hypothetical protein TSUD_347680 [Trifolium subterraneum]|nr:hypothetical protein TSUD_347680 [Trifolium subterraneum]
MLVERDSLWFRVWAARYGLERGRLCAGGPRGSMWWRELVRIRDGGGELGGGWFGEHIRRKVGDESDTFFWTDPWLDGIPLRGEAWVWHRPLAWEEEMLRECQTLLLTVSLQDHSSDSWQWQPASDSGYAVRGAYQLLTAQAAVPLDVMAGLVWHPQVPLKVSILAWRILRDRLPTKTNLITRGVLPAAAHLCVSGFFFGDSADSFRSLRPVYFVGKWIPFSSFLHATHMARQLVGCVDRAKSQIIPRLSKFFISYVGQDQDLFHIGGCV